LPGKVFRPKWSFVKSVPEVGLEPDVVLEDDDPAVAAADDVIPNVVVAHEAADLAVGDGAAVIGLFEFRHHRYPVFTDVILGYLLRERIKKMFGQGSML
jgi:hypothetical protein